MNNKKVKNMKIQALKNAIDANIAFSVFLPTQINGQVVDVCFLYPVKAGEKTRTRPFAKAVFEHRSGMLLEYSNAYINDFMDGEKYPMSMKIDYSLADISSVAQLKQMQDDMEVLYDDICGFFGKDQLSDEEKKKVTDFMELFYRTVPKDTLAFYQALAPAFFTWVSSL